MKFTRKFLPAIIVLSLVTVTAFASGPMYFFDDVPGMDEDGETESTWFTGAVYTLTSMGIIEGYDDGTYKPYNNVNRAEIAVLLDRLYNYIENPKYDQTWSEYSNDYYTVQGPSGDENGVGVLGWDENDDCSAVTSGYGDIEWMITCYSTAEESLENLIENLVANSKYSSKQDINLNGYNATKIKIYYADPSYISPSIYIFVETEDTIFDLYGYDDAAFEYFYHSFIPKD